MVYDFQRYLAAKRTVDDRALNRGVWEEMEFFLRGKQRSGGCSILEVGAGTGTMFQRMVEWGAFWQGDYYAIDASVENVTIARQTLAGWSKTRGMNFNEVAPGSTMQFTMDRKNLLLEFETVDVHDFINRETGQRAWELLVAHAFLDLFDIPALIPGLIRLVKPGGMLYLTINFDGETIFEPVWDKELENQIIACYHRTMDERVSAGRPSGDSRAGRHLFQVLAENHLEILSAGSADWVVYPRQGGYPADEAYFLHHILHFFEESVGGRAEIESSKLFGWAQRRHAEIERGELVFVAHQLDFLVRRPF
jgi:SAM-dependent methyltransferase